MLGNDWIQLCRSNCYHDHAAQPDQEEQNPTCRDRCLFLLDIRHDGKLPLAKWRDGAAQSEAEKGEPRCAVIKQVKISSGGFCRFVFSCLPDLVASDQKKVQKLHCIKHKKRSFVEHIATYTAVKGLIFI